MAEHPTGKGRAFIRRCRRPCRAQWRCTDHHRQANRAGDSAACGGRHGGLRTRLGPVLFQTPPHLPRNDERLEAFLQALPADLTAVFEFRNDSWFDEEVYGLLRASGAGLVLSETDDNELPDVVTAPILYLRLRKSAYDDAELASWASRMEATGADEVWAYLKHEDRSPELALALRGHLGS